MALKPISMRSVLEAIERTRGAGRHPDRLTLAPGFYVDTPAPFAGPGAMIYGLKITSGDQNAVGAYEREPRGKLEIVGHVWEPVA